MKLTIAAIVMGIIVGLTSYLADTFFDSLGIVTIIGIAGILTWWYSNRNKWVKKEEIEETASMVRDDPTCKYCGTLTSGSKCHQCGADLC